MNNCGCNQIAAPQVGCQKCHSPMTMTNIKDLIWVQGLDADLCVAFERMSDILGLRDCAGNRISQDTPIVACSAFQTLLCEKLAALTSGGEAIVEVTQLVGADCKLYVIPDQSGGGGNETPNTATDTASIDVSATGTLGRNISAAARISAQTGNALVVNPDGLFVPPNGSQLTACQQIQAFPTGSPAVPGTFLVGVDCQVHQVPADNPVTVSDTASVNLTLIGQNISADVILSPDSIGAITGDGIEITCADVLACAPPVTVSDTSTVDLTLIGQALSATTRISNTAGNDITVDGGGLYLDVCAEIADFPLNGPAVPNQTVLVGGDCQRYTLPAQNVQTVADTSTVDMTLNGGQLSAQVIVAPANLLQSTGQGLSVTCEDVQDCVFNAVNNFWEYNDAANQVLFNPSDDVGNELVLGSDNRPFVAPVVVTVTDTDCINLTALDNNITASIVISPQPNNVVQCIDDGLFVPDSDVTILGDATNCIDVLVNESPANTFTLTAVPILDPDAENALTCSADGLLVPDHFVETQTDSSTAAPGSLLPVGVRQFGPIATVTLTNPSAIRSMVVNLMYWAQNSFDWLSPFDFDYGIEVQEGANPAVLHVLGTRASYIGGAEFEVQKVDLGIATIGPGANITYTVRATALANAADTTWNENTAEVSLQGHTV